MRKDKFSLFFGICFLFFILIPIISAQNNDINKEITNQATGGFDIVSYSMQLVGIFIGMIAIIIGIAFLSNYLGITSFFALMWSFIESMFQFIRTFFQSIVIAAPGFFKMIIFLLLFFLMGSFLYNWTFGLTRICDSSGDVLETDVVTGLIFQLMPENPITYGLYNKTTEDSSSGFYNNGQYIVVKRSIKDSDFGMSSAYSICSVDYSTSNSSGRFCIYSATCDRSDVEQLLYIQNNNGIIFGDINEILKVSPAPNALVVNPSSNAIADSLFRGSGSNLFHPGDWAMENIGFLKWYKEKTYGFWSAPAQAVKQSSASNIGVCSASDSEMINVLGTKKSYYFTFMGVNGVSYVGRGDTKYAYVYEIQPPTLPVLGTSIGKNKYYSFDIIYSQSGSNGVSKGDLIKGAKDSYGKSLFKQDSGVKRDFMSFSCSKNGSVYASGEQLMIFGVPIFDFKVIAIICAIIVLLSVIRYFQSVK